MRCSTNIYLTALAVADIIYLLFVFVLSFAVYDNIHDRKYELFWRFFGLTHWLCDAASKQTLTPTHLFEINFVQLLGVSNEMMYSQGNIL